MNFNEMFGKTSFCRKEWGEVFARSDQQDSSVQNVRAALFTVQRAIIIFVVHEGVMSAIEYL